MAVDTMPALIIPADPAQDWRIIELSRRGGPQLKQLQDAVGGYLEAVRLPAMGLLWLNEEGVLKGLPYNHFASVIAIQPIMGDVVVTGTEDADGDITPIGDDWLEHARMRKERMNNA